MALKSQVKVLRCFWMQMENQAKDGIYDVFNNLVFWTLGFVKDAFLVAGTRQLFFTTVKKNGCNTALGPKGQF